MYILENTYALTDIIFSYMKRLRNFYFFNKFSLEVKK